MSPKTINYPLSQSAFTFFCTRGNYGRGRWEDNFTNRIHHYKKLCFFTCLSPNLLFLCIFPSLTRKRINLTPWKYSPWNFNSLLLRRLLLQVLEVCCPSRHLQYSTSNYLRTLRCLDLCLTIVYTFSPSLHLLSGRGGWCNNLPLVARAAQMLHQPHPNLPKIWLVLSSAYFAEFDEATYFMIMLRVLASDGFNKNEILSLFDDLFVWHSLANCRDVISADDFLFDWGQVELWLIAPSLVYRFTCPSDGVCTLSNRIRNAHLPSSGADEDYDMVNICLSCRLDVNLPGF